MRRRAKVDGNHADIVRGLRAVGCSVLDLSKCGGGCPDILVGRIGYDRLLEIKREGWTGPQGAVQKATHEKQTEFAAAWRGALVVRVTSLDEALAAVGVSVR